MQALVTGASRGIGKSIADLFSEQGISVLTPTRGEMQLDSQESVNSYIQKHSDVDILVNCAGINELAGIEEITEEMFQRTLQVNLTSPLFLMRALTPYMKKKGWGRVVNISSIWSGFSKERRIMYSIAKAGLDGATRASAVELSQFGILVNSVAPGFVNTELTSQNNTPEQIKVIAESLPIKRLADPREIAELVSFLASDRNSFMCGQTLYADGGFSCI